MVQPFFRDRRNAGEQLAKKLAAYRGVAGVIVLALPRGGVPVGYVVAERLDAPLDIFLVRKLGVPGREELAMGAIASGGVRVLNQDVVGVFNIPDEVIDAVAKEEQRELERREKAYRGDCPRPALTGRVCILVDDGLATGASMQAAVAGVRAHNPREIVVAVPTAAPDTCAMFEAEVDAVVCAVTPEPFYGVGLWYEDFSQTTDEEVRRYLKRAEEPVS